MNYYQGVEKERKNKSVVPFSVRYVLAVLCPSSHPPRQHGIGPERPILEATDKTI